MAPELFEVKPSQPEQMQYQDAILYGYKKMDGIVDECLQVAANDTTVVLCTGLSQQPMCKYEETGGEFDGAEADSEAQLKLLSLRPADGRGFMRARQTGDTLLASGFTPSALDIATEVRSPASAPRKFGSLFYSIGATSGMHHPDGILWISRPVRAHRELHRKVSLEEAAPTLMACIGVDHHATFRGLPMPESFETIPRPSVQKRQLAEQHA